jgi:arabinofuranosyltransferase
MTVKRTNLSFAILLIIVALAILALHAYHFLPFIADDALISLRYSRRLLDGQGLTWNPGERVEGYSNLLWVLGCAALGLARIDLVTAARLLGFISIAAAIVAVVYAYRPQNYRTALTLLPVLLFLPLSAPIAVWAIGGMEQPLVAGLLAWAVVLCYRPLADSEARAASLLLPGFLFALLCLTRLDGALFTEAAVLVFLLTGKASRKSWRKALALAALPVLFTLIQIAFRRLYYGEWVPNTALVKFTPSLKHALDGWAYVRAGAFSVLPLLAVAGASVVLSLLKNFRRRRVMLLVTMLLGWTAYLILIGGDIFPAWRHFVPLLVLLVLLAAVAAEWLALQARKKQFKVAMVVAVLLLGVFVVMQARDTENLRAISERWEWDGKAVGEMLKQAFLAQQPLMAVDPAGCLPYWSELPTVDMLGLNDYYLPRHPPPGIGQGAIGHELGDGQYVLNRKPDLVIFLIPTGNDRGYFLSGRQMQEDPRFFREYTLVRFETPATHRVVSRIWVRRNSGRIGIRQSDNQIVIPAFLLNASDATVAYLNPANQLVVAASRSAPARIDNLDLPSGRWRLEVSGQTAPLRVGIFKRKRGTRNDVALEAGRMLLDDQTPVTFEFTRADDDTLTIQLVPEKDGAVELTEVRLIRMVE